MQPPWYHHDTDFNWNQEPREEQVSRNRSRTTNEIQTEDRSASFHSSMTPPPPNTQWPGKSAAWGRAATRPLQMSHRTNPLFSLSTLSCRGATLERHRPLFVFPLFHRDRQRDGGGQRLHKPILQSNGRKSSSQDLCCSQQGGFSPHVKG